MIASDALKIFSYSEEEFQRYGQFKDMDGDLIGVKDGLTKLLRMDNLEPSDNIKWCCKEVK